VAFVQHLTDAVARTGKTPMMWGEAAAAPLPEGAVVQLWDSGVDPAPVAEAARAGAQVVLSPGNRVYLDMKYYEDFPLGLHWAGWRRNSATGRCSSPGCAHTRRCGTPRGWPITAVSRCSEDSLQGHEDPGTGARILVTLLPELLRWHP